MLANHDNVMERFKSSKTINAARNQYFCGGHRGNNHTPYTEDRLRPTDLANVIHCAITSEPSPNSN